MLPANTATLQNKDLPTTETRPFIMIETAHWWLLSSISQKKRFDLTIDTLILLIVFLLEAHCLIGMRFAPIGVIGWYQQ